LVLQHCRTGFTVPLYRSRSRDDPTLPVWDFKYVLGQSLSAGRGGISFLQSRGSKGGTILLRIQLSRGCMKMRYTTSCDKGRDIRIHPVRDILTCFRGPTRRSNLFHPHAIYAGNRVSDQQQKALITLIYWSPSYTLQGLSPRMVPAPLRFHNYSALSFVIHTHSPQ